MNKEDNILTNWDKSLLAKHLSRYRKLEDGSIQPVSDLEKHFVSVLRHGSKPVTQHEIAYLRYNKTQSKNNSFSKHELEPLSDQAEERVDILDEELISQINAGGQSSIIENIKGWYSRSTTFSSDKTAEALIWLNYLIAESSLSKSIERFSAENLNTLSNVYTKALDGSFAANGLEAGEKYVAPALHRLVETGHAITLTDAFKAAQNALPDDTRFDEIRGTITSLASDMSSVVGLPIIVLGKDNVDRITATLNEFGISDLKFADLASINLVEVLSSAIPALVLIFSWNKADTEKFSKIVGALAITSVYAGNPLGMLITLVGLAKSFHKCKEEHAETTVWAKSLTKGSLISTVVLASMSILGPVVWTTFIVAMIFVSRPVFNNYKISVDFKGLAEWLYSKIVGLWEHKSSRPFAQRFIKT